MSKHSYLGHRYLVGLNFILWHLTPGSKSTWGWRLKLRKFSTLSCIVLHEVVMVCYRSTTTSE